MIISDINEKIVLSVTFSVYKISLYTGVIMCAGSELSDPLVGHYCGQDNITVLPIVVVPSTSVWVRFVSDSSASGRGFRLQYSSNGKLLPSVYD